MDRAATIYRITALAGYFGLLALMLAWKAWLSPSAYFPVALVLIVLVAPLLLPLRGLLHGRRYTHAWSGFLALFYFTHGVVEALAGESERALASIEVVLSLAMFFGSALYVRATAPAPEAHA